MASGEYYCSVCDEYVQIEIEDAHNKKKFYFTCAKCGSLDLYFDSNMYMEVNIKPWERDI